MKNKLVVFDLGTSSLKVSLFEKDRGFISKNAFSYPTYTKDGSIRQNIKDWENAFKSAIRWIDNISSWENILCISFTGQMEDIIFIDEAGNPEEDVILYSDPGGQSEVEDINSLFGKDKLYTILGNYINAMMPLTKLYRMKQEEKLERVSKIILGGKDYLIYLLTKNVVTDPTNASTTGLYNIREKDWDNELLDLLGLKKSKLPIIYPPEEVIGITDETTEKELGIPSGIKVINGIGDAGASAIGAGIIKDKASYIYLGTTGWIAFSRGNIIDKKIDGIFTLDFINNMYLIIGAPLNVGKVYEFLKKIFNNIDISTYQVRNLPIFLPYLLGERSPFTDPMALASWIGINGETQKEDLILSALEGVAFSIYHTAISLMDEKDIPHEIILTGGVTKSKLWCQVFANVFGSKIIIPSIEDSPTMGAYLIGAKSSGWINNLKEAKNKIKKIYEKDTNKSIKHKNRFNIYRELYPLLKDTYHRLRS